MNSKEVLALVNDNLQAFSVIYGPKVGEVRESLGLPQNWGQLWVDLEFEPDTVSAKKFLVRTPYMNQATLEQRIQNRANEGLLVAQDNGEYYVEPTIRAKAQQLILAIEAAVAEMDDLLSPEDAYFLEMRLAKVIQHGLNSTNPPAHAIRNNHNSNPSIGAPSILKIFQYLTDLGAWRDDSHLAVWKHHNIKGMEWETFTFVWVGEKTTAAAISEQLTQPRGYTVEDYAAALEALLKRGWIESDPSNEGAYRVTEKGRAVRDEAEEATDRNYIGIFDAISAADHEKVWKLLAAILDTLRERAPVAEPA